MLAITLERLKEQARLRGAPNAVVPASRTFPSYPNRICAPHTFNANFAVQYDQMTSGAYRPSNLHAAGTARVRRVRIAILDPTRVGSRVRQCPGFVRAEEARPRSPRGQLCAFALAGGGARRSPFPVLALQHAGELPHRRTGDELDRHPVCAQRERQPLSVGSGPGEEGQATVPAERDVEPRRVGARCAPATLALDDPPPQGDAADDGADRLAQRVATPDKARRRLDRGRGVKSALTVGPRRSVQRWRGRPPPAAEPLASSLADGDRLAPRQPDGAVEGRAEAEALPARDDEPTPPADDRIRVVRRARGPGPLRRDLLRLARQLGRLFLRLFRQLARDRLLERLDRNSATRLADLHRSSSPLAPESVETIGGVRGVMLAATQQLGRGRATRFARADPAARRCRRSTASPQSSPGHPSPSSARPRASTAGARPCAMRKFDPAANRAKQCPGDDQSLLAHLATHRILGG